MSQRRLCVQNLASGTRAMDQWLRQNKVLIPWTILGLELAISIGRRLYRIKTGIAQDIDVIPSPVKTLLPRLSAEEAANLPYPPDAYPGARDVESPYGSLRVYEWGPEDGRKVVLVHGISNPSVALGAIAHGLVDRGCRVILLDMPGKGYSSTPVPTPHSVRLFTSSILLALTSSPISWTGNGIDFSMIGYSLGGGISANFTSYFPNLVSSLVLLAPAGLIRGNRLTLVNKFLYNTGLINESTLESIIKKKVHRGEPSVRVNKKVETPETGEVPKEEGKESAVSQAPVLSRSRPGITVANIVVSSARLFLPSWFTDQVSHHRHGKLRTTQASSNPSCLASDMVPSPTRTRVGELSESDWPPRTLLRKTDTRNKAYRMARYSS